MSNLLSRVAYVFIVIGVIGLVCEVLLGVGGGLIVLLKYGLVIAVILWVVSLLMGRNNVP